MKNTKALSADPFKQRSRNEALILGFFNCLTLFVACVAAFFVFTNGIPLVQLGILGDLGSKSRYVMTMRIFILAFIAVMALVRLKSLYLFEKLWVTNLAEGILRAPFWRVLSIVFLFYVTTLSAVGFMRHWALETRAFDLGIFSQAVWNTLQGDVLYSSIKGGINLMGDHVSPILAFLAPLYAAWADPRVLLIVQAIASGSCIFLIAYIAREKIGDNYIALIFAFAYCFYLPTRNALHEDFHPEVLAEPFILLAFIFLETRRIRWFLVSLLIMITAKENMLGIAFILGFYAFVFKNLKSLGAIVMMVSAALFVWEVQWVIPTISGKPYLYQGFYQHLLTGTPWVWLKTIFNADNIEYIGKIFMPVMFLSFLHVPTLILTFPILAQNLLSNNEVFRSFGYHYTTGLTPFVFVSAIFGWHVLSQKAKWFHGHQLTFGCLLFVVSILRSGPSEYYYFWQSWSHGNQHRAVIREQLQAIHPKAKVLTHNNFIPQLSERKYVYQFEYLDSPTKAEMAKELGADYVIFDKRFWEPNTQPPADSLGDLLGQGYRIQFQQDGFYILRHKRFFSNE